MDHFQTISMTDRFAARRDQMIRELQWEMAALVEAGEMTDAEANEWVNEYSDRTAMEG